MTNEFCLSNEREFVECYAWGNNPETIYDVPYYKERHIKKFIELLKKEIWDAKSVYSYATVLSINLSELFEIIDKLAGKELLLK